MFSALLAKHQGPQALEAGVIAPFPSPMPPVAHAECL